MTIIKLSIYFILALLIGPTYLYADWRDTIIKKELQIEKGLDPHTESQQSVNITVKSGCRKMEVGIFLGGQYFKGETNPGVIYLGNVKPGETITFNKSLKATRMLRNYDLIASHSDGKGGMSDVGSTRFDVTKTREVFLEIRANDCQEDPVTSQRQDMPTPNPGQPPAAPVGDPRRDWYRK